MKAKQYGYGRTGRGGVADLLPTVGIGRGDILMDVRGELIGSLIKGKVVVP